MGEAQASVERTAPYFQHPMKTLRHLWTILLDLLAVIGWFFVTLWDSIFGDQAD